MDIAAMSMDLSAAKLQMNVSLSMSKKVMDLQEVQAEGLMEMLPPSLSPEVGQIINVKA